MRTFWELIESNLGADFAEDPDIQEAVRHLSHGFTEGRKDLPRDYLEDPELQAAYLAYFVPLNFEKVYLVLSSHKGVWSSELNPDIPQRWIDLGSGPGTAVFAALAAFKNRYKKLERLPPIHIDLVDTQTAALSLGEILLSQFAKTLGLTVTVGLLTKLPDDASGPAPAAGALMNEPSYDLSLAVNVLNELPPEEGPKAREYLIRLWEATRGVMLVLEPGHRVSSQRLVRFRERLLKADGEHARILGPCQHQEKCPVHRTDNWCHFSEPVTDGRLIDLNLRIFKDPRSWLKFSYVLLRRGPHEAWDRTTYRAIGDVHEAKPKGLGIDLCMPEKKLELGLPKNLPPDLRQNIVRGATVKLAAGHRVESAKPMSKREIVEHPRAPRSPVAKAAGLPKPRQVGLPRPNKGLPKPKATRR